MLEGKRVAVVVPAHDEESLIAETLAGIPGFVDRIYVVDDASSDGTAERARAVGDPRVEVLTHPKNQGVGAAIVTGYKRAMEEQIDVTCVMAAKSRSVSYGRFLTARCRIDTAFAAKRIV